MVIIGKANSRSTEIKKTVAKKLLILGAFLPQWLLDSYKVSNLFIYFI